MSDSVNWIVDLDVSLEEAPALAQRVTDWLLAQEIVSPTLAPEKGYDGSDLMIRGERAEEWDPYQMGAFPSLCGLGVVIGRRVFDTGDNGIDYLHCCACNAAHRPDDVPWSGAVGAWHANGPDDTMACPTCGANPSIVDWRFDLAWGFGNLAFGFWNWPIDARLVEEIAALTGHRCRLVHLHI